MATVMISTPPSQAAALGAPVTSGPPVRSRFVRRFASARCPPDPAGHRPEIDQATGMLTDQAGDGIAAALFRLRACAYARDRLRVCS